MNMHSQRCLALKNVVFDSTFFRARQNPQPYLRLRISFFKSLVIFVSLTDETVELCSSLLTLGRVETRFTLLSLNRSLVRPRLQ